MKFTLKNCPDSGWKRGFEKELKRRYKLGVGTGYYYLLKEILGDCGS